MHDATAGSQPLHIATAKAGRRAQRIAVIDQPLAHECHRLEATVRVVGESWHLVAVVHAPTVDALEVLPHLPALQRGVRTERTVARRVLIEVVYTEQEWVDRRPLETDGEPLHDDAHATMLRPFSCDRNDLAEGDPTDDQPLRVRSPMI